MIKIGYIEDNDLLRAGITFCLNDCPDFEVSCAFKSIKEFCDGGDYSDLDLLIFDTYEDVDFDYISKIKREQPHLKLMILSEEERLFENYLFYQTNDIDAFLSKAIKLEKLIAAIRSIMTEPSCRIMVPMNLKEQIFNEIDTKETKFSFIEKTILKMVGKGKSNKEISVLLNLSYRTIETHRRRMIERLGCKNIIPVVLYALEKKKIEIEANFS